MDSLDILEGDLRRKSSRLSERRSTASTGLTLLAQRQSPDLSKKISTANFGRRI